MIKSSLVLRLIKSFQSSKNPILPRLNRLIPPSFIIIPNLRRKMSKIICLILFFEISFVSPQIYYPIFPLQVPVINSGLLPHNASRINLKDCGTQIPLHRIDIKPSSIVDNEEGCCIAKRGEVFEITVDFTPDVRTESLFLHITQIHSTVFGEFDTVTFPERNICNELNVTCPTVPGQTQRGILRMNAPPFVAPFPKRNFRVRLTSYSDYFYDPFQNVIFARENPLVCVIVPVGIA